MKRGRGAEGGSGRFLLPAQAKVDVVSPPAKAAVKDDQPPVPDWLHVGTAKKEWSLRITSPRTWTKTRPNDRRKK